MGKPSQNYGVLPKYGVTQFYFVAQHNRARPALTTTGEGWYSIYLPRRDGRLSWPRCLEYTPDGNRTAWSKVRRPNHCL